VDLSRCEAAGNGGAIDLKFDVEAFGVLRAAAVAAMARAVVGFWLLDHLAGSVL
jgi:hypothetical protein